MKKSMTIILSSLLVCSLSGPAWAASVGKQIPWIKVSNGSAKTVGYSLLEADGTLYAGASTGVWENQKGAWIPIKGSPNVAINVLAYTSGTLYAAAGGLQAPAGPAPGLWAYHNRRWVAIKSFEHAMVSSLEEVNGTLYVGSDSGVWSYRDGRWSRMIGSPDAIVTSLQYGDNTLYASTLVPASPDGAVWSCKGGRWAKVPSPAQSMIYALLYVKGTLYAGGFFGVGGPGVMAYAGNRWSRMPGPFTNSNVNVLYDGQNTLYAAGQATTGSVWTLVGRRWVQLRGLGNLDATALQTVGGALYASTIGTSPGAGDGIWRYAVAGMVKKS